MCIRIDNPSDFESFRCRKRAPTSEAASSLRQFSTSWPLFVFMATFCFHGHFSALWPLFGFMATCWLYGHFSALWPLFGFMATFQCYGHFSVLWPLFGFGQLRLRVIERRFRVAIARGCGLLRGSPVKMLPQCEGYSTKGPTPSLGCRCPNQPKAGTKNCALVNMSGRQRGHGSCIRNLVRPTSTDPMSILNMDLLSRILTSSNRTGLWVLLSSTRPDA